MSTSSEGATLAVAAPKKRTRQKKPFEVGPDGKTANQRLREVLESHPRINTEKELLQECNRLAGRTPDDPYLKQQSLNNILLDKDNLAKSSYVPILAEALLVRPFWLQTGIGRMRDDTDEFIERWIAQRSQSTYVTGAPPPPEPEPPQPRRRTKKPQITKQ